MATVPVVEYKAVSELIVTRAWMRLGSGRESAASNQDPRPDGVGLNLQGASRLVLVNFEYSPQHGL